MPVMLRKFHECRGCFLKQNKFPSDVRCKSHEGAAPEGALVMAFFVDNCARK
jgi:hypothetical protein